MKILFTGLTGDDLGNAEEEMMQLEGMCYLSILRSILGGNFAEIPQFLVFSRFFYQSRVKT